MFFRLCCEIKRLYDRLTRCWLCRRIHRSTYGSDTRVDEINAVAKDCVCENYSMSKFSPGVVQDGEKLARFVFYPRFHLDNKGRLKPNFFSHVATKGCSIQRETLASADELTKFVTDSLIRDKNQAWSGVVTSSCHATRSIRVDGIVDRAVCVFDTAIPKNAAHAEICRTHHIQEADFNELRNKLLAAFENGIPVPPSNYLQGAIWERLSSGLRQRPTTGKI